MGARGTGGGRGEGEGGGEGGRGKGTGLEERRGLEERGRGGEETHLSEPGQSDSDTQRQTRHLSMTPGCYLGNTQHQG